MASVVLHRFWRGFSWGLIGTLAMSALMFLGVATGISPMPAPVPIAIMTRIFGPQTTQPVILALAVTAHCAYGATWAALFASVTRRVTFVNGLYFGIFLWLLMQVIVLPLIGWGPFGGPENGGIWLATLILHLVYGGIIGWGIDPHARGPSPVPTPAGVTVSHMSPYIASGTMLPHRDANPHEDTGQTRLPREVTLPGRDE
jgi:hypothetical protein